MSNYYIIGVAYGVVRWEESELDVGVDEASMAYLRSDESNIFVARR